MSITEKRDNRGRGRIRLLWERVAAGGITGVSAFVGLLTIAIIVALVLRSLPILREQSLRALLTGTVWKPMSKLFGFWPFIVGTLWVTVLAMVIATPVCLLTAIYLAEYARPRTRAAVRPLLDVLAGIPSVVYGLFGVLLIVPFISDHLAPAAKRHWPNLPWVSPGDSATGYCVLAGGIVLALMVAPVIIAVAEEVLRTISVGVREASLSLGATRWETVKHVSLRLALPGLIASVVLGFARAFGETMAVLMVVGNVPQLPHSLFDPAYPLPALIANNYGEMMSIPLYDSALLLAALILLVVVLGFNLAAEGVLVWARRRAE
jgi:phosphate transport system permease protein